MIASMPATAFTSREFKEKTITAWVRGLGGAGKNRAYDGDKFMIARYHACLWRGAVWWQMNPRLARPLRGVRVTPRGA